MFLHQLTVLGFYCCYCILQLSYIFLFDSHWVEGLDGHVFGWGQGRPLPLGATEGPHRLFRWNKFELFVAFFFFKEFSFMGLWKGPMPSLEVKVGNGEMEGSRDPEERQG